MAGEMAVASATASSVTWSDDGLTRVPYGLYSDAGIYAREQAALFRGRTWNFLCLEAELTNNGDWRTSWVGETPVVVARAPDGSLNAFENRCAHRGALLCLKPCGNASRISCVYHAWSYDLKGNLTSVAFRDGIDRKGGMPAGFRLQEHGLRKLKVACFSGLVFGSYADAPPAIEDYLGPEIAARIRRVLNRPIRLMGRYTQTLPNNWKLYAENVRDTYHASLLHLFFTTFRLNRLSQPGGVIVAPSGGHHVSYSMLPKNRDADAYEGAGLRANRDGYRLVDPSMLAGQDEFGDGITLQILTVFPGFVLQQVQNCLAVRQIVPSGVGQTALHWTYFGFEDDDEAMTLLRLKQANLVGPGGYVSMEDGAVGGFVQRAIVGAGDDVSVVNMGGDGVGSDSSRATETSVRGFWQAYRREMQL